MAKNDTHTLFEKIINERGVYARLCVSESTIRQLRFNHASGKVSIDRMREILELAGYEVAKETVWRKKN